MLLIVFYLFEMASNHKQLKMNENVSWILYIVGVNNAEHFSAN